MPANCLRIGIEQKLVRVEAMAFLRVIGSVGAIAVDQTGARIGQIAVPDFVGAFRQIETRDFAAAAGSNRQSSIRSACAENTAKFVPKPVPRGAERIGRAALQLVWKC